MKGKSKGKEGATDTVFVVLSSMCKHYT